MKKAKSPAAMAAAELKARFKKELGLKVTWSRSEYYAGGCSVNIDVADPRPGPLAAAKEMAEAYMPGNFNGMEDIYELKPGFDHNKPNADYIFVNARFSEEAWDAAEKWMKKEGLEPGVIGRAFVYKVFAKPEFWDWYDKGCYDSVLAAKMAGDDAAADKMFDAAKAGEVIRLI